MLSSAAGVLSLVAKQQMSQPPPKFAQRVTKTFIQGTPTSSKVFMPVAGKPA